MDKYAVFESYCFGVNYFTDSGQCVPDYELEKTGRQIPTMDKRSAEIIAGRGRYRQIKQIQGGK